MARKITVEIISFLLILLYVYAAISKVLDYDHFTIVLGKSPLLTTFPNFVAIAIPVVELVIAVMLLIDKTQLPGLYASLFLLALFTSYLFAILNFSYYIPCSCGGIIGHLSWKAHIAFNLAFIALNVLAIIFFKKDARQQNTESGDFNFPILNNCYDK